MEPRKHALRRRWGTVQVKDGWQWKQRKLWEGHYRDATGYPRYGHYVKTRGVNHPVRKINERQWEIIPLEEMGED